VIVRRKEKDDAGFTLLEGMIATAILSIGVLAMAGLQGMSLRRNVDSTELSQATNLANEMMERIQYNRRNATAYNGIDTSVACAQNPVTQPMALGDCTQWRTMMTSQQASGISQASGITAARGQVQVNPIVTNPSLGQSQVVVTVTWTGLNMGNTVGSTRRVRMDSVIAPE
jgi:type IV pilus assembly protein PilV